MVFRERVWLQFAVKCIYPVNCAYADLYPLCMSLCLETECVGVILSMECPLFSVLKMFTDELCLYIEKIIYEQRKMNLPFYLKEMFASEDLCLLTPTPSHTQVGSGLW